MTEYPCPLCGGETDWEFDCPGYPGTWNGKETVLVCVGGCDNARLFFCKQCDWQYRTPNRRSDARGQEPVWIEQAIKESSPEPDEW